VRLEGLGKFGKKKSNNLIGNRTRFLPACSIVPQPTTLPRAPLKGHIFYNKPGYLHVTHSLFVSVCTRCCKHLHFEQIYTVCADTWSVTIYDESKCKTNSSIDVKKGNASCLYIWFGVRAARVSKSPPPTHTHTHKMTSTVQMASFIVVSYVNRVCCRSVLVHIANRYKITGNKRKLFNAETEMKSKNLTGSWWINRRFSLRRL
jgi:hypothetical protein